MKFSKFPAARRFLMVTSMLALGLNGSCFGEGQKMTFPGEEWTYPSETEAAGFEKKLSAAKAMMEELGATSTMIVKDGVSIAEWGDVGHSSNLHSVRKGILSALIGIAVENKKINLEQTLEELQIDDNEPVLTPEEKTATLHDLLKARSGIYHPALYESESMKAKRPLRGSHSPGSSWYYNNWDFNALGTIYEKAVGRDIFTAFDEEIAKPLGMQDYTVKDGKYVSGPDSNHRAYPIKMSARDLARFVLLYLNDGVWNGNRILPKGWVEASVTPHSLTDNGGGYGYMWWTNSRPDGMADALPGSYYASGVGGQAAYVVPSENLVVVVRVDTAWTEKRINRVQIRDFVSLVVDSLKN